MEKLRESHRGVSFPDSGLAMKQVRMSEVVRFHRSLKPLDGALMSNDLVKWHYYRAILAISYEKNGSTARFSYCGLIAQLQM